MISPLPPFIRPGLRAAKALSRVPASDRWLVLLGNYRVLLALLWVTSVLVWVVDEASPIANRINLPATARIPELESRSTPPPRAVWEAQFVYASSPMPTSAPSPRQFE